jgi:hypothetical protein
MCVFLLEKERGGREIRRCVLGDWEVDYLRRFGEREAREREREREERKGPFMFECVLTF